MFLDPDFGWRLKTGELILTHGIPRTDPFTYTMPTFPWVDHAFSQSVFIFVVHSILGFAGLAFIFSAFALLTIWISSLGARAYIYNTQIFKNTEISFGEWWFFPRKISVSLKLSNLGYFASFPLFLFASILFSFFGIRVQVVSWLMYAILIFVLFDRKKWERLRFLTPIFFLIWSNLHGSFLSGLTTLFLFLSLKAIRRRVLEIKDVFYLVISFLVTLVNPYGTGLWREVWSSVSDPNLRWAIAEWMPAVTMMDMAMVVFMAFSFALTLKYRKKINLEEKALYIAFLLQAFGSRRHLPLWAIIAFPITVKGVFFLYLEAKKFKGGLIRLGKMYTVVWVFCLIVFFVQAALSLYEAYNLGLGPFYPKEAVVYLSKNIPKGEIFSEYGWGGYLIWKLPEKKVFIDGRMPSWRRSFEKEGELASSFDTYTQVQGGEIDYRDIFDSYNITTVLWRKTKKETPLDKLFKTLEQYFKLLGYKREDFDFITTLEKDNWKKIYEDNVSVIYENPNFPKKSD